MTGAGAVCGVDLEASYTDQDQSAASPDRMRRGGFFARILAGQVVFPESMAVWASDLFGFVLFPG